MQGSLTAQVVWMDRKSAQNHARPMMRERYIPVRLYWLHILGGQRVLGYPIQLAGNGDGPATIRQFSIA